MKKTGAITKWASIIVTIMIFLLPGLAFASFNGRLTSEGYQFFLVPSATSCAGVGIGTPCPSPTPSPIPSPTPCPGLGIGTPCPSPIPATKNKSTNTPVPLETLTLTSTSVSSTTTNSTPIVQSFSSTLTPEPFGFAFGSTVTPAPFGFAFGSTLTPEPFGFAFGSTLTPSPSGSSIRSNIFSAKIISDEIQDGNEDGTPDALVIYVSLDMLKAGNYIVSADLYGGTTQILHSAGQGDLAEGVQNVFLEFDGDDIRASNINGPYSVTNLSITSTDPGGGTATFNLDYQTGPYKFNENFGGGSQPNLVPQLPNYTIIGIFTGIFILVIFLTVLGLFAFLLIRRNSL